MRHSHVAASIVALAVCHVSAIAQAPREAVAIAIDAAVASHLRASLPTSGIAFETRPVAEGGLVESRSSARIQAFARAIGGTPVHGDTVFVCAARIPSTCTLRHATTLLSFSDAAVTGDSAIVHLTERDLTGSARMPVSRRTFELHLVRDAAGWRVTRIGKRSIS